MLTAFDPQLIHELKPRDKARIEALLAYGDRLLVGLSTGGLRVYRVNAAGAERAVELLREEEKFSRRAVLQLALVKGSNLLVSLSDAHVSLHDLQTYVLVERLEATRGATCFAITSQVVRDGETGIPCLLSRLAVGVKRKVLCWTWRDMELDDAVAEVSVEATVKSLTWITGSRVVVGMDPGFVILDVEAEEEGGVLTPVYGPAKAAGERGEAEMAAATTRFGAVSSSGMGYVGMGGWVPKPLATALAGGEALLAKDVNTLFVDSSGHPLDRRQVPWALAPDAIGYSYPYLLALLPPDKGALQIRNPDTLSLLQNIHLPAATILHVPPPNISLAHAGKNFLVASERAIWRMNSQPYDSQVRDLLGQRRYDEAISLLTLLEDTLIDDKAGRIREVKTLKAEDLFRQQKYRPALDLFTDAETAPERVIALYPKVIAGDLSTIPEPSDHVNGDSTVPNDDKAVKDPPATPSKGGMLSKLMGSQSTPRKDSDAASIKVSPAQTDSDSVSVRNPKASPANPSADKPLEGKDLKLATYPCLTSFLAQARVKIQRYLNTDGTLKKFPPDLDPETKRPAFANLLPRSVYQENTESDHDRDAATIDYQSALFRTAQLVDTTLFRAYMLASPSFAGPLFRLDNFCDPEVVQASLYEHGRYQDLIDFLHGKKLHRQALELLAKFGRCEHIENAGEVPDNMKGPDRTVAYLKQLPPELVDLILEFVRWPLTENPAAGMSVFFADSDNAERLPRAKILSFLASFDEEERVLQQEYLEHVITEWNDQTPEFHQRLADIYIHRLKTLSISNKEGDEQKQILKRKLEEFLRNSKKYQPGTTFRQLIPADNPTFFEARAIVLCAMGNHKQALSIYVYSMHDYVKAEEYCNRVYASEQETEQQPCLLDMSTTHEKHGSLQSPRPYSPPITVTDSSSSKDSGMAASNIFATLLGLYLRPPAGEETRWPQALDLLSRHGARLPASSTLELMPADLAVRELESYFLGRMRTSTSALRQSQVMRALSSLQKDNAERHLLLGPDWVVEGGRAGRNRNMRVRITEDDHCGVCHKRFGASAVRVWPTDGEIESEKEFMRVVHYGCVPGKHKQHPLRSGVRGWG